MPTYEYKCKSCGNQFDLVQKISDPPPAECPECGKGPIQKVFTSVGIIFKGSGFHVNDYRKSSPSEEGSETAKPEAGTESKAEAPASTEPAKDTSKDSTGETAKIPAKEAVKETPASTPTPAAPTKPAS